MKTALVLAAFALVAGSALAFTPLDLTAAGGSTYYLPTDAGDEGLWEETNGLEGLQQTETVLEDGTVIPADSRLA